MVILFFLFYIQRGGFERGRTEATTEAAPEQKSRRSRKGQENYTGKNPTVCRTSYIKYDNSPVGEISEGLWFVSFLSFLNEFSVSLLSPGVLFLTRRRRWVLLWWSLFGSGVFHSLATVLFKMVYLRYHFKFFLIMFLWYDLSLVVRALSLELAGCVDESAVSKYLYDGVRVSDYVGNLQSPWRTPPPTDPHIPLEK